MLGTKDETEVYEMAGVYSPVLYDGLVRGAINAEHKGGGVWLASVEYAPLDPQQAEAATDPQQPTSPGPNDPLGPSFSFDTSGQTVHITQSKGTRSKTDATGTTLGNAGNNYTLDTKRAIGLTKDRVEGCDVPAPCLQFQVDDLRANCTDEYLNTLSELTGRVNYGKAWRNRAAGTVLYLGASGRFSQKDRWNISHKFAYRANETDVRISDTIVVPVKKGWDYIWVEYADRVVVNNQLVMKPTAAYVEYVHDDGDFSRLEIGD